VGSLRISVAWTQAGFRGARFACFSFASTIAHAPSDDGPLSRKRSGSQSIGDFATFSIEMSGNWRCA
jgi:hypothetical protein